MENELKEIVIKMLRENTGTSILDSGGAYGRHWERNQKISSEIKIWDDFPVVELNAHGGKYPELYGSISLYHHLINCLEIDSETEYVNKMWEYWDNLHPDMSYSESMESFYNCIVSKPRNKETKENWDAYSFRGNNYSAYTYNEENSLNQDFAFVVMGEWIFIQIHGGCDARGGFTKPRLFKFNDDLFNVDDYTIYCTENNHYWDKQGYNSYYTETDVEFEKLEICDYDELSDEQKNEFDKAGLVMGNPEINYAYEGQKVMSGFDVRLQKPAGNPKLIIKDKIAYCPICGSELKADKIYSG